MLLNIPSFKLFISFCGRIWPFKCLLETIIYVLCKDIPFGFWAWMKLPGIWCPLLCFCCCLEMSKLSAQCIVGGTQRNTRDHQSHVKEIKHNQLHKKRCRDLHGSAIMCLRLRKRRILAVMLSPLTCTFLRWFQLIFAWGIGLQSHQIYISDCFTSKQAFTSHPI